MLMSRLNFKTRNMVSLTLKNFYLVSKRKKSSKHSKFPERIVYPLHSPKAFNMYNYFYFNSFLIFPTYKAKPNAKKQYKQDNLNLGKKEVQKKEDLTLSQRIKNFFYR